MDTIELFGYQLPWWSVPAALGGALGLGYLFHGKTTTVASAGLLPTPATVGVPVMGGGGGLGGGGPIGGVPAPGSPVLPIPPEPAPPVPSPSQPPYRDRLPGVAPGNVATPAGTTAPGYPAGSGIIGWDVINHAPIYSGGNQTSGGYLPRPVTHDPVLSGSGGSPGGGGWGGAGDAQSGGEVS